MLKNSFMFNTLEVAVASTTSSKKDPLADISASIIWPGVISIGIPMLWVSNGISNPIAPIDGEDGKWSVSSFDVKLVESDALVSIGDAGND